MEMESYGGDVSLLQSHKKKKKKTRVNQPNQDVRKHGKVLRIWKTSESSPR